tara:strand:+ start:120 stop:395 length:276 start_codon:yes stop_codon:yes gene_type:complete
MAVDTAYTISYIKVTINYKRIDMIKTYYVLAIDYGHGFGVEFGAYSMNEILDFKYDVLKECELPLPITKTIKTIDNQRAIDAAINKLNNKG